MQRVVQRKTARDARCALHDVADDLRRRSHTVAEKNGLEHKVAEHHEGLAADRAEQGGAEFPLGGAENERGDHGGARLDDERARGIQCIACEQIGKTGAESGGNTAVERPGQQCAEYHDDVARV